MIDIDEIKHRLRSRSPDVRRAAFADLFAIERPGLYYWFLGRTKSREDSEDLLHDLFIKLDDFFRRNPIKNLEHPKGYLYRSAYHLVVDKSRKNKDIELYSIERDQLTEYIREARIEYYPASSYESVVGLIETVNYCLQIEDETVRFVAVLRFILRLSYKQICLLMGWRDQKVAGLIREANKQLRNELHNPESFRIPNQWKQMMWFTNDEKPLSVSFTNVFPNNLHPASIEQLQKDLGIGSLSQLRKLFVSALRIEGVDTMTPSIHYTFFPRGQKLGDVFKGEQVINYVSYIPHFASQKKSGKKDEKLVLEHKVEFDGKVVLYHGHDSNQSRETIYEIPALNLTFRKAFNLKLVNYEYNPNSQETTIFVYRNYPLDPNKPSPLAI